MHALTYRYSDGHCINLRGHRVFRHKRAKWWRCRQQRGDRRLVHVNCALRTCEYIPCSYLATEKSLEVILGQRVFFVKKVKRRKFLLPFFLVCHFKLLVCFFQLLKHVASFGDDVVRLPHLLIRVNNLRTCIDLGKENNW